MIKQTNERVTLTLSKKQVRWIKQQAKLKDITPSRFVAWLLALKINEINTYMKATNEDIYNDLEWLKNLDETIRIAKTPWIKDNR